MAAMSRKVYQLQTLGPVRFLVIEKQPNKLGKIHGRVLINHLEMYLNTCPQIRKAAKATQSQLTNFFL